MATPLNMYSLTWDFNLYRTTVREDHAEFTCFYQTVGGAQYGDAQLIHAAAGGAKAWTDNITKTNWCDNVTLSSVTATSYLANGHTFAVQQAPPPVGWTGTSDPPALPWETSLCMSLYTYPRGSFVSNARRKRGRFYLPPMAASCLDVSNSGYFDNATIAARLGEVHDFLEDSQNDELGVQIGSLGVYSRVDGICRAVTQISCDAKFDSQRRRQNRETAGVVTASF